MYQHNHNCFFSVTCHYKFTYRLIFCATDSCVYSALKASYFVSKYSEAKLGRRYAMAKVLIRYAEDKLTIRYVEDKLALGYAEGKLTIRYTEDKLDKRYTENELAIRYVEPKLANRYTDARHFISQIRRDHDTKVIINEFFLKILSNQWVLNLGPLTQ